MNKNTTPQQPATGQGAGRAHPAALTGLALLVAGLVAWMWLGDYRWALTGLAGLFLGLVLAAFTQPTTEWRNCTPALLASGVDCDSTPRRPGTAGVSHQHLVERRRAAA